MNCSDCFCKIMICQIRYKVLGFAKIFNKTKSANWQPKVHKKLVCCHYGLHLNTFVCLLHKCAISIQFLKNCFNQLETHVKSVKTFFIPGKSF